jgi:hypothetical protein
MTTLHDEVMPARNGDGDDRDIPVPERGSKEIRTVIDECLAFCQALKWKVRGASTGPVKQFCKARRIPHKWFVQSVQGWQITLANGNIPGSLLVRQAEDRERGLLECHNKVQAAVAALKPPASDAAAVAAMAAATRETKALQQVYIPAPSARCTPHRVQIGIRFDHAGYIAYSDNWTMQPLLSKLRGHCVELTRVILDEQYGKGNVYKFEYWKSRDRKVYSLDSNQGEWQAVDCGTDTCWVLQVAERPRQSDMVALAIVVWISDPRAIPATTTAKYSDEEIDTDTDDDATPELTPATSDALPTAAAAAAPPAAAAVTAEAAPAPETTAAAVVAVEAAPAPAPVPEKEKEEVGHKRKHDDDAVAASGADAPPAKKARVEDSGDDKVSLSAAAAAQVPPPPVAADDSAFQHELTQLAQLTTDNAAEELALAEQVKARKAREDALRLQIAKALEDERKRKADLARRKKEEADRLAILDRLTATLAPSSSSL